MGGFNAPQLDYAPPPRWHRRPLWRALLQAALVLGVFAVSAWLASMGYLMVGWVEKGGTAGRGATLRVASDTEARRVAAELTGAAFRRRVVDYANASGADGSFTPEELSVDTFIGGDGRDVIVTFNYPYWHRWRYHVPQMSMMSDRADPTAAKRNQAIEAAWRKALAETARPQAEQEREP